MPAPMKDIRTLRRLLVENIAATKNEKSSLDQFEDVVRSLEKSLKPYKERFQTYQPAWIKIEPSFIRGEESLLRLREFLSFSKNLNNLNLFISLCLQDVMLLVRPPTAKRSGLEKNFEARLVALHCYEFTSTLSELLGNKRLSKDGSEYCEPGTLLCIRGCRKAIALLREQNIEQWKAIRNNCIGHRENDAFEQLSIIESLNPDRLEENGNDFCEIMVGIIQALTEEIRARSSKQAEILEQSSNLCKKIVNNIKSFARGDPEWKV
jgi:hypothetical protein